MSSFYIDGLRVPALFHMLVGGGVIHAGLIDRLEFFPGAYDVTYGRSSGGVAAAATRPARGDRPHLEAELRLFDVSGLLELKLGPVRVSASGHYGYPGPIVHAIDRRIDLNYWDYHLRVDWRGVTLQAFGSYDHERVELGSIASGVGFPALYLTFHRLQLVGRLRRPGLDGEVALYGGLDDSGSTPDQLVRKLSLGFRARLWRRWRRLHLFAGVDGELAKFRADGLDLSYLVGWTQGPGTSHGYGRDGLGEIGDERLGGTTSAAVQLTALLVPGRLDLTVGGRVDLYAAGAELAVGFDPRVGLRLVLTDWLTLRVGAGVYQQPPSFPIQMPGIDTFALQLGLMRATHAAVTEELLLPGRFTLGVTGYYQRFDRVTDLPPLGLPVCAPPPSDLLSGATAALLRVVDGQAYGMELLLRRSVGRVSGWVAYTLSRSERFFPCGLRPADYDQPHILNVVLQVALPAGIRAGARLFFSSGRPQTQLAVPNYEATLRNNVRLPDYVQLDLRLEKVFRLRRATLTLLAEVVNASFSESALLLSYPASERPPGVDITRPEVAAFRWLLPSLGLRLNL